MTDTRPTMTRAAFEAAAAYVYRGHWLTGEEHFLHVPAVMQVEGWNVYGHPGQAQLTEPQRVLMMWSDLVGQTANGGFIQFVDNLEPSLQLAYASISKLEWPDLFDRFDKAFREQAGDPRDPKILRQRWDPFSGEWPEEMEEDDTTLADAFDEWFYLDETKAASREFIGGFIRRNRDLLAHVAD